MVNDDVNTYVIDHFLASVLGEIGRSLRDYTIEHAELVGNPLYILPDGTLVSDTAWNHWMWQRTEPDMAFRWGCYVMWSKGAGWLSYYSNGGMVNFWEHVEDMLSMPRIYPGGVRFAPGVSHLQLSKELL